MIFLDFMNEYPKNEELHQSGEIAILQQIQTAMSLAWKKIMHFVFSTQ